jgi:hypothetical protein
MHSTKQKLTPIIVALAAMSGGAAAHGQSADALIDKLVQKGILTTKEANELREESDKGFNDAFKAKTGISDWVTALKFSGDFRGRFEQNNAESTEYFDRNRYRMRLRFGVVAGLGEQFDVGFRLASGNPQTNPGGTLVGGQPITANQDLNSLESRKFLWIDAAFARWNAVQTPDLTASLTLGKMDNPFLLSNMIWDYDIDPEGAALQATYKINDKHSLKLNSAFFVLDEINQGVGAVPTLNPDSDPYVYGAQLLYEAKWTPKLETSIGAAAFNIGNKESLSSKVQPYYNSGTTRDPATGAIVHDMNPVIGTASVTYWLDSFPLYPDKFPIKVAGEYMYNGGAPSMNTGYRAGLTLGKAGKKKSWEVAYRYQRLEGDAWFDALVDDDNGAFYVTGNPQLTGTGKANGWFGGTNVKGHLVQATYSFTDFLNFTFTYYMNDLIVNVPGKKSDAGHFMTDIMWKF